MTDQAQCTCTGDPKTMSCDHRFDCPLYLAGVSHDDGVSVDGPTKGGCCDGSPMRRMTVKRVVNRVRLRFEFCCVVHSPTPWIETEHTVDGALRMARDILNAAEASGESTRKTPQ